VILFLDTVSSLPEFSIIEDNKIIHSNQILSNQNEQMSDLLIPSYLSIEKKYNLKSKLQLLLINTGPGSYTALRVGIAFFSGLSLSQNIDIIGLPCIDLYRFIIPSEELMFTGVYISSSNDQNFIYFFDLKVNQFKIKKIEKNKSLDEQDIDLSILKKIYINESLQGNLNIRLDVEVKVIKFSKLINQNIKKIEKYKKNEIIEPLYFSNNKILN
jgi:tRNA A37 threonylcarbamoyladenosine modification protein TsaB